LLSLLLLLVVLLLLLLQGGVRVIAWVFGHQVFDMLSLLLHPALFFAWLYVLTLSPVPAYAYYMALVAIGWYTSGVGYLVGDYLIRFLENHGTTVGR
jgi:hypothetical protein